MTTPTRDHWECVTCGCGVCCAHGVAPDPLDHVGFDGRVCGRYAYGGPCDDPDEDGCHEDAAGDAEG